MLIKELQNNNLNEYNKMANEYGSVFNKTEWLNVFSERLKLYGIFDKGTNLIGGFFIYKTQKWFINLIITPPFTPNIGLFYKNESKNPSRFLSKEKEVVSLVADFFNNQKLNITSFNLPKNINDTQPFYWNNFKSIVQYTYIIDLKKSQEDIYSTFSSQRKKSIRKAISENIVVKKADDFSIIEDLALKTFSRQKIKIDTQVLKRILYDFSSENNAFAFICYDGRYPISCVYCVYDKKTAYYLLGGYDEQKKHHGAGPLAMWHAIQYSKKLEIEYFDFEGSMQPQIERYLRAFGGSLIPFYRINKASLFIEQVLKISKRSLF